jgi:hippurate hydrolase
MVGAHIYLGLQTIIRREVHPAETSILTVGMIKSGETNNVIPETAIMKGTIRTYNRHLREFVIERLHAISTGIAESFRAEATVRLIRGCPALINNETVARDVHEALEEVFRERAPNMFKMNIPRLSGSEDFSYIAEVVPTVMILLFGGSPSEGYHYGQHHPKAMFNETVLPTGAAAYEVSAMGWLARNIDIE